MPGLEAAKWTDRVSRGEAIGSCPDYFQEADRRHRPCVVNSNDRVANVKLNYAVRSRFLIIDRWPRPTRSIASAAGANADQVSLSLDQFHTVIHVARLVPSVSRGSLRTGLGRTYDQGRAAVWPFRWGAGESLRAAQHS